jgi:hypothetical protein
MLGHRCRLWTCSLSWLPSAGFEEHMFRWVFWILIAHWQLCCFGTISSIQRSPSAPHSRRKTTTRMQGRTISGYHIVTIVIIREDGLSVFDAGHAASWYAVKVNPQISEFLFRQPYAKVLIWERNITHSTARLEYQRKLFNNHRQPWG